MNLNPLRRSQLIAPVGVGALYVLKGGVSVIACGLDYWYERQTQSNTVNTKEFEVREYRLEKILKVNHFRLPPDFREGDNVPNSYLTVPFLRFPRWHVCSNCGLLDQKRFIDKELKPKCGSCRNGGKFGVQQQVAIIAMCPDGHIQDFPWREWVHKSSHPSCNLAMKLSTGGASLGARTVRCSCGVERSLVGVMNADTDGTTTLSKQLAFDDIYFCRGHRPWLGDAEDKSCDRHLRAGLRGASNVWFGRSHTSIFLPQSEDASVADLLQILQTPGPSTTIETLSSAGIPVETIANALRGNTAISAFSEAHLLSALNIVAGLSVSADVVNDDETESASFRLTEYDALRKNSSAEPLLIDSRQLSEYDDDVAKFFSRISLVSKLRETRVFAGFSRVIAGENIPHERMKEMLWKDIPGFDELWLPASVVNGEGIFLQLNEERLVEWESRTGNNTEQRIALLTDNFERVRKSTGWKQKSITARFVLLHTFAHLLINRLTFECGYTSASLRERIYVSASETTPMAGILIYTAAGDSEGTMGGLVRMGKPGYFEPIVRRAIESAEWCSADPVCRELGAKSGQGPDSCNLAACHSCALLPETSCEEFNRFLDRSMVVDGPDSQDLGFFTF